MPECAPHLPLKQVPLIITVDVDDQLLLSSPEAEWYRILKFFPDADYWSFSAAYYRALYHFNKTRTSGNDSKTSSTEQQEKAKLRLLFERATMDKDAPVILEEKSQSTGSQDVSLDSILSGAAPDRSVGGKKPKDFFSLFKSFIGASIMGFAPEPEKVHMLLESNPSFARVCGFVPKGQDQQYWHKYIPSLRKLEQFDQIMTEYGLWSKAKWEHVSQNIKDRVIQKETVLVGDTTHYHAHSGFETVKYTDENGKDQKKSQSKTIKNCRCQDWQSCDHPWQLADDGAGTIVKGNKKMIWGHKASILGLPLQGIPLDAVAVSDAATFDGETLLPHVIRLFENLPGVKPWIDTLLYDSACDNQALKDQFQEKLRIRLMASLNPRRKAAVTSGLPRGMEKLSPYGDLFCKAGIEMEYKGMRYERERFIYQAPLNENKVSVCSSCEHKSSCCPVSKKSRVITIPFDTLSHIDPNDPPMAKRFKAMMTMRPSVERIIKRLKCDLSDDRLSKRGNDCFQAYLDKTMIAFHILLRRQ